MTPYAKFLKLVIEKGYFDQHEQVLVALSGGLDSMTLFDWLYQASSSLGIRLSVAHVNHQQRSESDAEAEALQKKMQAMGVPFHQTNFQGVFSEARARHFRYDFFESLMLAHGITALVTAHHKQDDIETFIMRQMRGSRLRHLTGMQTVQPFGDTQNHLTLIRPLLSFEKAEFETSTYFEDASNAETTYFRNRVRNLYLPAVEKENPRFSDHAISLMQEIDKAMAVVHYSARAYKDADKIDLIEFSREIEALRYFILQDYLAKFPTLTISKPQFDELLHIIQREGQYCHGVSNDFNFIKDHTHFYIEESAKDRAFETSMTPFISGDYQAIDIPVRGEMMIRKRQPGDRILVNGVEKKLRRYFIDAKVALQKRDNPVLLVDNKIYGVLDVVTTDLSKSLKHVRMKRTLYYREKG